MPGIVFEGADASGKSTLTRKIAELSGRSIYRAGGRPKDDDDMWRMIDEQARACSDSRLVDRVSCISQQIYREGMFFRVDLMDEVRRLIDRGNVLVYCRPPDHIMLDPKNHEWKGYDTAEWRDNILANQRIFVDRYDLLMSRLPCVIYDWTSEDSTHIEQLLGSLRTQAIHKAIDEIVRKPNESL